MELMHFLTYLPLLLTIALTLIAESSSIPIYDDVDRFVQSPIDRFDEDYYISYPQPTAKRSDASVGGLKNGYYYIDNGDAIPVARNGASRLPPGQRRQDYIANTIDSDGSDNSDDLPDGVKFTPLVRFKQTHTRRKKLFVPNFFG